MTYKTFSHNSYNVMVNYAVVLFIHRWVLNHVQIIIFLFFKFPVIPPIAAQALYPIQFAASVFLPENIWI